MTMGTLFASTPDCYRWCDPPADPVGPWRIFYGTHQGDLASRDEGQDEGGALPDWPAVVVRMHELIAAHHRSHIWHASAHAPDGRRAPILWGAPHADGRGRL